MSREIIVQRSEEEQMLWLQLGLDLDGRTFELRGFVDDNMTAFTLRCLTRLTFESLDPITIYLNTPGGSATDGFAIYDLIKACPCEVTIVALGQVCSMGPVIMVAGKYRHAFPNTRFMVHAPRFTQERETSVDHHLDDVMDGMTCKKMMIDILTKNTSKPASFWNEKITKQDYSFDLKQAEEYGIVSPTVKKEKANVRKPKKRKNGNSAKRN